MSFRIKPTLLFSRQHEKKAYVLVRGFNSTSRSLQFATRVYNILKTFRRNVVAVEAFRDSIITGDVEMSIYLIDTRIISAGEQCQERDAVLARDRRCKSVVLEVDNRGIAVVVVLLIGLIETAFRSFGGEERSQYSVYIYIYPPGLVFFMFYATGTPGRSSSGLISGTFPRPPSQKMLWPLLFSFLSIY